jgi:hypothetical protein
MRGSAQKTQIICSSTARELSGAKLLKKSEKKVGQNFRSVARNHRANARLERGDFPRTKKKFGDRNSCREHKKTWRRKKPQQVKEKSAKQLRREKNAARKKWWRRGELNPRPKSATDRSLHAYLNSVCDPALAGRSRVRQRRLE